MKNIITTFTKDEINTLKMECNFTPRESVLLDLRNHDYTLETCAEIMNYSIRTVSTINKAMICKIQKVLLL